MRTSDFDYVLPAELVASFPAPRRDRARLLRLDKRDGTCTHLRFDGLIAHLPAGALLVLNDTRVIPARLRGRKQTGGLVELLLLRRVDAASDAPARAAGGGEEWEALGRNLGQAAVGTRLEMTGGLVAEVRAHAEGGAVRVGLHLPAGETSLLGFLDRAGELPLPPYIEAARKRAGAIGAVGAGEIHDAAAGAGDGDGADDRDRDRVASFDRERYQTVYAEQPGAVAAPTAGLHFTDQLLARIAAAGHRIVRLTLHVGPGTFRPVKVDDPDEHELDPERYVIPPETAEAVEEARRAGRPVLAVGTTVVRALESAVIAGDGVVRAGAAASRLFLRPGSRFDVVTDLITNFHLPRSTLLMLVAAFAGRERVLRAYAEAVAAGYHFYSYGDAMLIRGTA